VVTRPNPSILLRFSGELTTKARATRRRFEQRLVRNLRDALEALGVTPSLEITRDRYFVRTDHPEAAESLSRVFGIQSVARIATTPAETLEQVVRDGYDRFADAVAGKSFAVRARRVGGRDRTPVSGGDVAVALGDALRPGSAGVDLTHPEIEVRVELHRTRAFWIERELPGPGGLPLGTEGRAVVLLSGGFDSAVAAWQLMRRGVQLDFVFCNLGGDEHLRGALRVAHAIASRWAYGAKPRFHAVDFEEIAGEIRARVKPRYWQIVLKRQMLRCAEAIARERDAEAIVTGDALGQVSSQTLTNLSVISSAASLPVLRPLIGSNKDAIVRQAEAIGTAALSASVEEYCAMAPTKPATAAKAREIERAEQGLAPEGLGAVVEGRALFELRALDLHAIEDTALAVEEVSAGATVLDLRSKAAYAGWHYPGALRLDFDHAMVAYPSFERARQYLLYCEIGMKSAHLAERMRRAGFDASHLAGGLRAAMRCAKAAKLADPELDLFRDKEI
jgi:thiamine biosynthesis protein ThiI